MSGKLTAYDIRMMLLELDIAEKHRERPGLHADALRAVRDILLRAALRDVDVGTQDKP
jgi:hypothetical protein